MTKTAIKWTETYPEDFVTRGAFVSISDGETTHCTPRRGRSLRALANDYASTYGFNSPGDVEITVWAHDRNGDVAGHERYTIRSQDGCNGRLV